MIRVIDWDEIHLRKFLLFCDKMVKDLTNRYEEDGRKMKFYKYVEQGGRIRLCVEDGEIIGMSMCRTFSPLWNHQEIRVYIKLFLLRALLGVYLKADVV